MTDSSCPLDIDPADVAAWAVDGEPHPEIDLAAHVPGCPACRAVVSVVMPSAAIGLALRASAPPAPLGVERRAMGRIRMEATALLLLRTFFGAAARVIQAVPPYVRPPHESRPRHESRHERRNDP
ncbi:MAG: hypothetical protein WEB19_05635 [Acidimicrobiia bacterium]